MNLETIAVRGGFKSDRTTKAVVPPIYQTTSYAFDDTQHGADLFDLEVPGNHVRSLACHPASTTHRQLSDAELASAGVSRDMARLSIGIEHIDDLLADVDQALAAAR